MIKQPRTTPVRRACRLVAGLLLLSIGGGALAADPPPLETDREWNALPAAQTDAEQANAFGRAGRALGSRVIRLAGVTVDRGELMMLSRVPAGEPMTRAVRERLGRPVDVTDLLLFLDDLIGAHGRSLEHDTFWVPSGRARAAGILLHPDDIFGDEPRRYGDKPLALFQPQRPAQLEPAHDGDSLGPRWTARFENPVTEAEKLTALETEHPGDFADRLRDLLRQFREQGAEAWVYSTVRSPERGYLIYGSFILSRARNTDEVERRVAKLDRLNREWDLHIPIRWRHPDGTQATIDAALGMANAYDVVYATQWGARHSSHYTGLAADFAVLDLPRTLTLTPPGGGDPHRFDLSGADEARDLNLTPELIRWVERAFGFKKLRGDYPHWSDASR